MGVLIQFPARPAAGPAPAPARFPAGPAQDPEAPPKRDAFYEPSNNIVGELYDRDLPLKEIAKLMRAAFKAEIPGVKFSVRCRRYTYSWVIDVEILEAPFPLRKVPAPTGFEQGMVEHTWTPEALALKKQAQAIHDRWNYDRCHLQSDYFDVNYYGSVSFGYGAA